MPYVVDNSNHTKKLSKMESFSVFLKQQTENYWFKRVRSWMIVETVWAFC